MRVAFFSGSGSVSVSGADFFRGRSLGMARNSGASVESGVDGALEGALRTDEGSRAMLEMEMAGGNTPIFLLVASCVALSNSRTSSIVMSSRGKAEERTVTVRRGRLPNLGTPGVKETPTHRKPELSLK